MKKIEVILLFSLLVFPAVSEANCQFGTIVPFGTTGEGHSMAEADLNCNNSISNKLRDSCTAACQSQGCVVLSATLGVVKACGGGCIANNHTGQWDCESIGYFEAFCNCTDI